MSEPSRPTDGNDTVGVRSPSLGPADGTLEFKPDAPAPTTRPESSNIQVPGYRMLGVLGRGGMGVVYKAIQEKANRPVALKMILAGSHADQSDRLRFKAEAEAAARLSHPNIVQLYEVGETPEGFPFFSLEFVAGGSLADLLKQGPLRPQVAAALVEALARAMQYAHEHGIVHRDIKPLNILLEGRGQELAAGRSEAGDARETMVKDPGGVTVTRSVLPRLSFAATAVPESRSLVPKISDFGLAKQLDSDDGLTRTGAIMGSPAYMAPEQAFGHSKHVGPAADIYALGAILYECLTGRPPFKGATIADTLDQVRTMEPVTLKAFVKEIPRDLETICLHCLHKEPQKRYASAEALADDLRRYQEQKPISVRPVGTPERVVRWCRRNPGWAAMIAVIASLLVGIAGISFGAWRKADADNVVIDKKRQEADDARIDAEAKKKLAEDAKKLAEARGEQALKAVGLFATDARVFCEDAMVPGDSRAKLYGVLIKQLEDQADQAGEATIDALRNKAFLYQTLCAVNLDFGKFPESKAAFDKGISAVERWEKIRPGDPAPLTFRAALLNLHGNSLTRERKLDGARKIYAEALAIREKLVGDTEVDLPNKVETLAALADSLDSVEQFEKSIELREKICKMFESDKAREIEERGFAYREALCWTYQKAGLHATDYATRKEYLTKADTMSSELMGKGRTPRNILLRWSMTLKILGELEYNHGKLAEKSKKPEEAEKYFEAASQCYRKLKDVTHRLATSNEMIDGLRDYARSFYTLGLAEKRKGNLTEARKHFQMSYDIRWQTLHDYTGVPGSAHLQIDLFFSQLALGELSKTLEIANNVVFALAREPDGAYRMACIYALVIDTIAETRSPKPLTAGDKRLQDRYRYEAFRCLQNAHDGGFTDFFQSNVDADLDALRHDPAMKEFEATHEYQLGAVAKKHGDLKKARAHFEKAQDLARQFMKAASASGRYQNVQAVSLCTRIQLGQHAEAIAEADGLWPKLRKDAAVLFLFGRVYALASAGTRDPKLQEHYRARAVEALETASVPSTTLGPVVVTEARLVEEDDLDPLRSDPRFVKILEKVKQAAR